MVLLKAEKEGKCKSKEIKKKKRIVTITHSETVPILSEKLLRKKFGSSC